MERAKRGAPRVAAFTLLCGATLGVADLADHGRLARDVQTGSFYARGVLQADVQALAVLPIEGAGEARPNFTLRLHGRPVGSSWFGQGPGGGPGDQGDGQGQGSGTGSGTGTGDQGDGQGQGGQGQGNGNGQGSGSAQSGQGSGSGGQGNGQGQGSGSGSGEQGGGSGQSGQGSGDSGQSGQGAGSGSSGQGNGQGQGSQGSGQGTGTSGSGTGTADGHHGKDWHGPRGPGGSGQAGGGIPVQNPPPTTTPPNGASGQGGGSGSSGQGGGSTTSTGGGSTTSTGGSTTTSTGGGSSTSTGKGGSTTTGSGSGKPHRKHGVQQAGSGSGATLSKSSTGKVRRSATATPAARLAAIIISPVLGADASGARSGAGASAGSGGSSAPRAGSAGTAHAPASSSTHTRTIFQRFVEEIPVPQFITEVPEAVWLAIVASLALAGLATGAAVVFGRRARRQAGQMAKVTAAALTDPLTGLLNRRGFTEAVERELARSARYSRPFVLAYIDVRGLKGINDTEGHLAGDQLLRGVASVLTASARAHDLIGRLGGDEFGLLLPEQSGEDASVVGERIADQVAITREALGFQAHWDLTIGTAAFPADGTSAEELISVADRRLYEQRGIELVASR